MNSWRLVVRSLRFHARVQVVVALGVAAATAVLTGALVVGDSVRGSLRELALSRLGPVDGALVANRFFREALGSEVFADPGVRESYRAILPAILLEGTLERPAEIGRREEGEPGKRSGGRANRVTILGVGPEFWADSGERPGVLPGTNQIVLNAETAKELGAVVGSTVILRLPRPSDIPADSPLGRKRDTSQSRSLEVAAVVPAAGLGAFGLRPSQQTPRNAFVTVDTLQSLLDQPGRVNALLAIGKVGEDVDSRHLSEPTEGERRLAAALRPTLEDAGLRVEKTPRGYINYSTNRMVLEPAVEEAILQEVGERKPQSVLVYLANWISVGESQQRIPYSTVAALDVRTEPPLGPLELMDGRPLARLGDAEIVLNSWAADDLTKQGADLKPGTTIRLVYFEPESTHGKVAERTASFRLAGIVKLAGAADDAALTPELKGVTDKQSIDNWDPPFPYDSSRVRARKPNDQDDQYWKEHKATPKAFVSLAAGRKLWESRFGRTTSIRAPVGEGEQGGASERAPIDATAIGLAFLPVKRLALLAASGTTPFDVLFLSFSFFLIAAAVLLIAILYKLGIDRRASEIGILRATGIGAGQSMRLLAGEGLMVAAVGGAIGAAAGVGYAWLMLTGLKTWWLAAITTPFLDLHVSSATLAIGGASGAAVAMLTIVLCLRQTRKASVRSLLGGEIRETGGGISPGRRRARTAGWAMLGCAAIAAGTAIWRPGESQVGTFFASGGLVLSGLLALAWDRLRRDPGGELVRSGGTSAGALARLAVRNGARAPVRSTLTIGLMAAACFMIVAMGAFRLSPPDELRREGGSGGYALICASDQPIYQDLNSNEGRAELGFDSRADKALSKARIVPLRVQAGDDASCLNLYQPRQPRVLGVGPEMAARGGFAWSASGATTPEEEANPWRLLNLDRGAGATTANKGGEAAVPVVLDQNTALYSLHLTKGIGERFEIDGEGGKKIPLVVVGLLRNSVFQGDLLIGEADFRRLYPNVNGNQGYLVHVEGGAASASAVAETLEEALSDYGFDAESTGDRLAALMAVQNTYLSTFQSLGGLGLLLGTFGLAAVQVRSVFERRKELALMRAAGFRRRRLAEMVMWENAALLLAGLGIGTIAALVAIAPNLFSGDAGLPWRLWGGILLLVCVVGMVAGLGAVRAALRAPLLAALRGE